MLAVARDPTSSIRGLLLQDHKEPIESLKRHFHQAKGRSAADKNAQHIVPQWYGEACVLCGFPKPQGAHIVPVRAVKKASPYELWDVLSGLWPLSMVSEHELVLEGRECTNILPLCPNAHWLWDSHNFALRPIEDQDPEKRQLQMYLQVLWLKHHGSTDVVDILSDFRRVRAGPHPGIRHGDVYQLTTSDPTNQPLPNVRLLQIQLGVHKIYAGIRAAAEAGAIFRGNPPDDDGTAIPSGWTPTSQWQVALDAAVGAGALDVAAAERWRVAILQHELARIDNLLGKRSPLGSVDEGPEDAV
ncbi:hypothetical protein SCUCBS95973_007977 [Sporothrix curviconia]|uniref:HNH nuclease domain-containing protein n=1 Tax=Sporothrix curviconia TaxID=1260050 RepID=A0ABP0CJ34_9PEZI